MYCTTDLEGVDARAWHLAPCAMEALRVALKTFEEFAD